jgi:hypothetical protein
MHVPADNAGSHQVFLLAPEGLAEQLDELVDDLLREGCLESLVDVPALGA